jgi:hypothetical protein
MSGIALRQRPALATTLTAVLFGTAWYKRLPFTVPPGVHRLDVTMTKSSARASLGIGLFDASGAGYQSGGFRGIFGEDRSSFFVSTSRASEGFVPGPMPPGTWTVLVPVFRALVPTKITVTVRMSFEPDGPAFEPGPLPGVVVDSPGWYRGDLHCHTTASSDAWACGSALTPAEWAHACRATGLDYVAMTDHNVISQNYFLARDAGADVLLIAGEEMTNWFHGHATVSGIDVGQWLDFRQSPAGVPMPTGNARIGDVLALAEEMGAFVAAAHPMAGAVGWQFLPEALLRPRARTRGFEVWSGPWQIDDEAALAAWDRMLRHGWRTVANGGSDLHGVDNDQGFAIGKPTTVAYAQRLAQPDVIAALRDGRCFVTRSPDGVEVYLTAMRADQETYVGGSVYGEAGDPVTVRAHVRRGDGMRLTLIAQGAKVHTQHLDGDDVTAEVSVPIPKRGGYVRAEVRGRRRPQPGNRRASELNMEAFTNPVWLVVGDPPRGYTAECAPVPRRVGPRRSGTSPMPQGLRIASTFPSGSLIQAPT